MTKETIEKIIRSSSPTFAASKIYDLHKIEIYNARNEYKKHLVEVTGMDEYGKTLSDYQREIDEGRINKD